MSAEIPVVLNCAGDDVAGIYHATETGQRTAFVIAVGGPQYRVGSHRQFVLMARSLADSGFSVLRFDYRGMGDSAGAPRSFEDVDDDIRNAIDYIFSVNRDIDQVILIGLCDAASACLMYGSNDPRVVGQILLNPWVRSAQGRAKSYLRHYYLQRFVQKSFWRKLLTGKVSVLKSASEFLDSARQARGSADLDTFVTLESRGPFVSRMLQGVVTFRGPLLFLISRQDLTAGEFTDLCKDDRMWKLAMNDESVETVVLDGADHTLSSRERLDYVNSYIVDWAKIHLLPGSR